MYVNGRWYTESELNAYVKKLESIISTLEDKHWNECRQIAHYEDELKEAKKLLELAIEGFDKLVDTTVGFEQKCVVCDYAMKFANPYDACNSCPLGNGRHARCTWKFKEEAMKLIGEEQQ